MSQRQSSCSLPEGIRAVVRNCMSPFPVQGPLCGPFYFFGSKPSNLQVFKALLNDYVGEMWSGQGVHQ